MALDSENGKGNAGGSNVVDVDFGGGARKGTGMANENEGSDEAKLVDKIHAEIKAEPRTIEQLAVAVNATEKQIRNAVTALRRKFQMDSGDHVVSFKRQYWTAAELERRGHKLEPTSKGTLKVTHSTKTTKTKKPAKAKKSKKTETREEIAAKVLEELGDSPDAQRVAGLIVKKYDAFMEAEAALPKIRTKARDLVRAAEANFKETIEEGIAVGDQAAAVQKLHGVESAWQNLSEKKSKAIEIRKTALEARNRARDAFSGVMENIRQLDLFADVA